MKIAIITLPFHANYGGILQAFALQTVLEGLGHEVVVLDKDMYHHRSWIRQQISFGAHILRKYLLHRESGYHNIWREDKEKKAVEENMRTFVDKRLNIRRVNDLPKEFPCDMDAVVVGSDQVWRPKYFIWSYECGVDNAYLSFLQGRKIKRMAYAASFGTSEWEYSAEETIRCSSLIKLFDAVSVREDSAIHLCKEKLGREDVCRMPDPVFLLSQEDYRSIIRSHKKDADRHLFYYVLNDTEDIRSEAERIARERNLTIKQVKGDVDNPDLPLSARINPSVEEWLDSIINADFVFTDSFHACVFSILFKIPFVVLGNSQRGMSRFTSLLSIYNLEKHLISSERPYNNETDYAIPDDIDLMIERERQHAYAFLSGLTTSQPYE